jgi:hypothetical protein
MKGRNLMAAVMKGFQETYIKLSGNQVCIGVGVTKVTGKPNHPAIYQGSSYPPDTSEANLKNVGLWKQGRDCSCLTAVWFWARTRLCG